MYYIGSHYFGSFFWRTSFDNANANVNDILISLKVRNNSNFQFRSENDFLLFSPSLPPPGHKLEEEFMVS